MPTQSMIPVLCAPGVAAIEHARVRPLGRPDVILPVVVAYLTADGQLVNSADQRPLAEIDKESKANLVAELGTLRWSQVTEAEQIVHVLAGHEHIAGVLAMARIRKQIQAKVGSQRVYVATPRTDMLLASRDAAALAILAKQHFDGSPEAHRLSPTPLVLEGAECIGTVAVSEQPEEVVLCDAAIPILAWLAVEDRERVDEPAQRNALLAALQTYTEAGRLRKLFQASVARCDAYIDHFKDRDITSDLYEASFKLRERIGDDMWCSLNDKCIAIVEQLAQRKTGFFRRSGKGEVEERICELRQNLPTDLPKRRVTRSISKSEPSSSSTSTINLDLNDDDMIMLDSPTGERQVLLSCTAIDVNSIERSVRKVLLRNVDRLLKLDGFNGNCRILVSLRQVLPAETLERHCREVAHKLNDDPDFNQRTTSEGHRLQLDVIGDS